MSALKVSLVSLLAMLFLSPVFVLSQTPPWPPCCTKSIGAPPANNDNSPLIQGQLVISDQVLQSQGLTRRDILDRLSLLFFPGRNTEVVFQFQLPASIPSEAAVPNPLAVQVLSLTKSASAEIEQVLRLRVPISDLKTEDLDGLDEVSLTDSTASLSVKFTGVAPLAKPRLAALAP